MELLPYCVCCCVRGISRLYKSVSQGVQCLLSSSLQLCALGGGGSKAERKEASAEQNRRLQKEKQVQVRRKQERQQRQNQLARRGDLLPRLEFHQPQHSNCLNDLDKAALSNCVPRDNDE